MTSKITFNGKEYSSVNEMLSDVHQAYEKVIQVFQDKDHDGVPDIFQGGAQIYFLSASLSQPCL